MQPMVGMATRSPMPLAMASANERRGFVKKVYGILSMQLLATLLLSSIVVLHGHLWLATSPQAMLGALTASCFVAFGVAGVSSCCPSVLRRFPENYILLTLLTVAESMLIGCACLHYSTGSIFMCCGLTAGIVIGLTMFAVTTKSDFTGYGPYLVSFLVVFTLIGFILSLMVSLGPSPGFAFNLVQLLYAGVGALMASAFLVFDTQMILGDCHEHKFSVDDYAMAALVMYLDVIQLFLSLLRLLGREGDDSL